MKNLKKEINASFNIIVIAFPSTIFLTIIHYLLEQPIL
jgi:hypothetical protein